MALLAEQEQPRTAVEVLTGEESANLESFGRQAPRACVRLYNVAGMDVKVAVAIRVW